MIWVNIWTHDRFSGLSAITTVSAMGLIHPHNWYLYAPLMIALSLGSLCLLIVCLWGHGAWLVMLGCLFILYKKALQYDSNSVKLSRVDMGVLAWYLSLAKEILLFISIPTM